MLKINSAEVKYIITYYNNSPFSDRTILFHFFEYGKYFIRLKEDVYGDIIRYDDVFIYDFNFELDFIISNYSSSYYPLFDKKNNFDSFSNHRNLINDLCGLTVILKLKLEEVKQSMILNVFKKYKRKEKIKNILCLQ